MGDSSDNRPPDELITNSNNNTSKNLICNPKTTLKNVEVFDITSNKKYIATVDSDYMLHVYKIIGNFEDYEEITVFEIYNSKKDEEEEDYHGSPQTYSSSSDKGIRICSVNTPPVPSPVYVSLSISFDKKFVTTSVSALHEDRSQFNIYSTEEDKNIKNVPTIIDTKSEEYKKFRFSRPVFLNDRFILVTNASIHVFNLKFERLFSKETCTLSLIFNNCYAACNYVSDTLRYQDDIDKMTREQTVKMFNFREITILAYMTGFIKQDILIEPFKYNTDRIWLPEMNKSIASITRTIYAEIVAISENKKYIATFDDSQNPTFYIYLLTTGSLLHEITLDTNHLWKYNVEKDPVKIIISHTSFQFNGKYLFISGYTNQNSIYRTPISQKQEEGIAQKDYAFCQLWNIPAQRMVYHREYGLLTTTMRNPLIFTDPRPADSSFSVTYINRNDNDELATESFDISIGDTAAIQYQQISPKFEWKEWHPVGSSDKIFGRRTKGPIDNDKVLDLDSTDHDMKRYVLDYNDNRYILLFGYFSVQMYRLEPSEDNSIEDSEVFNSDMYSETDIKYSRYTFDHQPIYIKIYNSALTKLPHLLNGDELDAINVDDIEVKFDTNGFPGRTLVTLKSSPSTSEANEDTDDYFEELFLPMELITQNTPNKDLFEQGKKNNNLGGNSSENPQTNKNNSSDTHNESEPVNEEGSSSAQNIVEPNNNVQNKSEPVNENNASSDQKNEEEKSREEYIDFEFHYLESTIQTLYFLSVIENKRVRNFYYIHD
jgi:hypothetical protein